MGGKSDYQRSQDLSVLRSVIRRDLVAAMKARQPDAVAALRTALSAIDNAEAVEAPGAAQADSNPFVAGAQDGVGSTEAHRRILPVASALALLEALIAECETEADHRDARGHPDAAAGLRREAEALKKYLSTESWTDSTSSREP